jgi:hypothetical protein
VASLSGQAWSGGSVAVGEPVTPEVQDVAVMSIAAAADLASTHHALRVCSSCSEGMPWMREPAARYAFKAVGVAGTTLACRELRKRGHGRAAKVLRWTVAAVWLGLAAHNMRMSGR